MRTLIATLFLGTVLYAQDRKIETLHLGGEAQIQGSVVKETQDAVFVDVGYTILEVPKRAVLRREAKTEAPESAERQVDIFFTSRLKKASVQELVEQFGEAVVMVQTPSGLGSGFIINDREGYVVTNNHVIEKETRISITVFVKKGNDLENVKKEKVKIVALSPFLDLALLKIEDLGELKLKKVYLGSMDDLKVGDPVFAVGNPWGLKRTVTEGIVSVKAREMEGVVFIQTSAPINPGNSGGPLFNDRGEVIGVNSRKVAAVGAEGLGFAIPVTYVKDFLKNRDAYAYDKDNPNTGVRYFEPPKKKRQ